MGDTPINFARILEQARDWTFDGDFQLLQWMNKLSQNLEARATKTTENLDRLNNNVKSTHAALDNVANSLTALQYGNQFVECRVQDDDETLLGGGGTEGISNGVSEPAKPTFKEMLTTFLDNNLKLLRNCHEKYSVQLDDSDDDDETNEKTCIFQPINPYNDKPLPHIFGSKEWSEKWHVGLSYDDQDNNYSGDEISEAFSETSSSSAAADNDSYEINSEFASSVSINNEGQHSLGRNAIAPLRRSKIEPVSESSSTHSSAAKISTHKTQRQGLQEGLQAASSSLSSLHSKSEDTSNSKPNKETNAPVSVGKPVAVRTNIPPYVDLFAEPPEDLGSTSSTPSLVNQITHKPVNFFSDDNEDDVYKQLVIAQSKRNEPPKARERTNLKEKATPAKQAIAAAKTSTTEDNKVSPHSGVPVLPPLHNVPDDTTKKSETTSTSSISKTPKSLFDDDDDDDDDFLSAFVRKQQALGNPKLLKDPVRPQNISESKQNKMGTPKVISQQNPLKPEDTPNKINNIQGESRESKAESQQKKENTPRKFINLFDDVEDMDYDIFNKTPSNRMQSSAVADKPPSTEPKASNNNISTRSLATIMKSSNLFDDDDDDDDDDFFKTLPSVRNSGNKKIDDKDKISITPVAAATATTTVQDDDDEDKIMPSTYKAVIPNQIVKPTEVKPFTDFSIKKAEDQSITTIGGDVFKTQPLPPSPIAVPRTETTSSLLPPAKTNNILLSDDDDDDDNDFFTKQSSDTAEILNKEKSAAINLLDSDDDSDFFKTLSAKPSTSADQSLHKRKENKSDHLTNERDEIIRTEPTIPAPIPNLNIGDIGSKPLTNLLSSENSDNQLQGETNETTLKTTASESHLDKNVITSAGLTQTPSEIVVAKAEDSHSLHAEDIPTAAGNIFEDLKENSNEKDVSQVENVKENIFENHETLTVPEIQRQEILSTSPPKHQLSVDSGAKLGTTQVDSVEIETESQSVKPQPEQSVNINNTELSPPEALNENEPSDGDLPPTASALDIAQEEKKSQTYGFNSSILFDEPPDDDDDNDFFESLGKSPQPSNTKFSSFDLENDLYPEPQLPKIPVADTSTLAYAGLQLFNDIPPDDDDDSFQEVMKQRTETTKRLNTVFYDDFSETLEALNRNQGAIDTHSIYNNEPPPAGDVKEFHEPKLEELPNKDVVDHLQIPSKPEIARKLLSNKLKDPVDQDDQVKEVSKSSGMQRPIAKLQLPNININVQALLPGMSGNPPRCKKPQTSEKSLDKDDELPAQEPPQDAKETQTPRTAETEHILPSINKTRVKAPLNRRPSTRKARQESYRKSLLEEDILKQKDDESQENEDNSSKDMRNVIMENKQQEAVKSQLINTSRIIAHNAIIDNPVQSSTSSISKDTGTKPNPIATADKTSITDAAPILNPKTVSSKKSEFFEETQSGGNNDNDTFKTMTSYKDKAMDKQNSESLERDKNNHAIITNTATTTQSTLCPPQSNTNATSSENSQKSLSGVTKTHRVVKTTSKLLFTDSESDDDLFSKLPSTKSKLLESKRDKTTNSAISNKSIEMPIANKNKPHTASLFSDDSDEDDDFLKTTANTKPAATINKAKIAPQTKSIFSDLEDSDDGDLFGSNRKTTNTQTFNTVGPSVAETKSPSTVIKPTVADNPLADLL